MQVKILPGSWVSRAAKRKDGRVFLASFLLVLLGAGQAPILAGPLVPLATTPPTVLDNAAVVAAPDATPRPNDPAQGTPQDLTPPLDAATDPKLLNADAVMAAFEAGASDTAVIVTLQPTAEAAELAAQSELSPNRPEDLTSAAAPIFYDLQDPAIRTRLRATVTQAVGQAIHATQDARLDGHPTLLLSVWLCRPRHPRGLGSGSWPIPPSGASSRMGYWSRICVRASPSWPPTPRARPMTAAA